MTTSFFAAAGAPPFPGSMAWLAWRAQLFAHYRNAAPIARAASLFIKVGTMGLGTGFFADPFQVATPADFQSVVAANSGAGNVRFRLLETDTVRISAAALTSIAFVAPSCTIDAYSAAGANVACAVRPRITGFQAPWTAGWTNVSGNVWKRTQPAATPVSDVQDDTNPDHVWRRVAPAAANNANMAVGTFYHDTANTLGGGAGAAAQLYARCRGSEDPNTLLIEGCIALRTVDGILDPDYDQCRVDGLALDGWAPQDAIDGGAQQRYLISGRMTGTNLFIVTRCSGYKGGGHGISLYGGAGGCMFVEDCTGGLLTDGSATSFYNGYASGGSHEFVTNRCSCTHGSRYGPATTDVYNGTAAGSHTTAGVASLILHNALNIGAPAANRVQYPMFAHNNPAMASEDDWQTIRFFNVGCVAPDVSLQEIFIVNGAQFNNRVTCNAEHDVSGVGTADSIQLVNENNTRCVNFNNYYGLNFSGAGVSAQQYMSAVNSQSASTDPRSAFNEWDFKTAGGQQSLGAFRVPFAWGTELAWDVNSIFRSRGVGLQQCGFKNAAAGARGMANCAYRSITAADGAFPQYGYNNSTAPTTLGSDPPEPFGTPSLVPSLAGKAGALPNGWVIQFDMYERPRINGQLGPLDAIGLSAHISMGIGISI